MRDKTDRKIINPIKKLIGGANRLLIVLGLDAALFVNMLNMVESDGKLTLHSLWFTFGVIVFSNNGGVMPEWDGVKYRLPDEGDYSTLTDGGKGYRLRCDMIEKARTAREGVEILTGLVKKYGYTEPSRLFTIADKDEIWVVQVIQGRRFVAR